MDKLSNTIIGIGKFTNTYFSIEVTCPICGFEVDLWTDEEETICHICGYKIFHKERIIH